MPQDLVILIALLAPCVDMMHFEALSLAETCVVAELVHWGSWLAMFKKSKSHLCVEGQEALRWSVVDVR